MNAITELPFDCDQWLLENTREPKPPFRTGSTLHRLNIQNGRFYKEVSQFVIEQGRELEEGSLVLTVYDKATLTKKVGVIVQNPGGSVKIGLDGTIAFNVDAAHKQFVVALPDHRAIKLADTGYPIIWKTLENLYAVIPENIAILDGMSLFKDMQIDEMTNQELKGILNEAYKQEFEASLANQAALSVVGNAPVEFDKFTPFPEVNGSGKPTSTIENLEEVLRRMGAIARYNVIKKEHEILITGKAYSRDNHANASFAQVLSHCNRVGMPVGQVEQFLIEIAEKNKYNPVLTWVQSKPWDGVKRWDDFCRTIIPKEIKPLPDGTPLHIALIKRWMVSAIAAAASCDGIAAQGILVFQGEQNLGKTNWFKSLAPEELNVLEDGLQLRVDDKDSVKQVISNWLVELGEIDATFKKSDIAALKSFITRKKDIMRLPYARKNSDFARRTVFFGSVNPREFLHDDTGNRRYWVIECESVNFEHDFDMQQVWSEIYHWYKANPHHADGRPSYTPTADELAALNANNEEFQVMDPIEERVMSKLDWSSPQSLWRWATVTEVLMEVGVDKPTKSDVTKAGKCIREHNGGKANRSGQQRKLLVPSLTTVTSDNYNQPF